MDVNTIQDKFGLYEEEKVDGRTDFLMKVDVSHISVYLRAQRVHQQKLQLFLKEILDFRFRHTISGQKNSTTVKFACKYGQCF